MDYLTPASAGPVPDVSRKTTELIQLTNQPKPEATFVGLLATTLLASGSVQETIKENHQEALAKIVATKRLQSEGLWNEASLYGEKTGEHLRGEGMTRKEANKGAWEKMLEAYPPFDADDEAALEPPKTSLLLACKSLILNVRKSILTKPRRRTCVDCY